MSEQRTLFPAGLSKRLFRRLSEYADVGGNEPPTFLLRQAESHLEDVQKANCQNALINARLAAAICSAIRVVVADWDSLPTAAHPWLRAAVHYFAHSNDDQPDFSSPIGFEDDAEVLNACLRLAGRDELCLKPEDYDDA